jgi:hypothetical protein
MEVKMDNVTVGSNLPVPGTPYKTDKKVFVQEFCGDKIDD